MNYLITGALGFIGSNFVNYYHRKYPEIKIIVLDKIDYCSSLQNITGEYIFFDGIDSYRESTSDDKIKIIKGNILDEEILFLILNKEEINIIIHFAAESHVDNSFNNSLNFTMNNVLGTHVLLEITRLYHEKTSNIKKFIHVSTDEVYGEVFDDDDEKRIEESTLDPTNPYAATKAAAEFIVKSYFYSYKLPIIITRANNVYGKSQFPEKIIPKFICQILDGNSVTIHGQGLAKRNFIHVDDISSAYDTIIEKGEIGSIYNISAPINSEFSVMEIARTLFNLMETKENILHVPDRNFNDNRYYTSSEKLEKLGWQPTRINFIDNLKELIEWYRVNRNRYNY